jgi:catechol 2,3-dioxygenase-like lactoylglutathione lyase family enzyme
VSAFGAGALQAPTVTNKAFPVTTVNHLAYSALDYAKTRDFYVDLVGVRLVWDDGKKCQVDIGPEAMPNSLYITQAAAGSKPTCGHFAFGVTDFKNKRTALAAELYRRKFDGISADLDADVHSNAPSGFLVQETAIKDPGMFPGAGEPCSISKSDPAKCKAAYEEGHKNLGSIPKPSGKGFTASYFKYIILHVPDVAKERDFYTSLLGMKVVSNKADEVFLRFGQNTLLLRPAGSDGKPECHEFGFVIQNYDEAKVKAELDRRGLSPKKNSFGGWVFNDLNGLAVGIAGRG